MSTALLHFRTVRWSYCERIMDRIWPVACRFCWWVLFFFFSLCLEIKLWALLAFPFQQYFIWFSCMNNITQHWKLIATTKDRKLDYPWSCALYSHSGSLQNICEITLTWNCNFLTNPSGRKWKLVPLLYTVTKAQSMLLRGICYFFAWLLKKTKLMQKAASPLSPNNFQPPCSLSTKFDRDLKNIQLWEVLHKSVALLQDRQIQLRPLKRQLTKQ